MTIPAHIPFAVSIYINPWNLAVSFGTPAVTVAADIFRSRLFGPNHSRISSVSLGYFVALTAWDVNMVRYLLLVVDTPVAG